MTDIRTTLCAVCRGQRYPRQCRNSAAWRKAQHAPADCLFDIPLNNLPIGDNAPPVTEKLTGMFKGPNRCKFLIVIPTGGCCDNEFFCTWGDKRRELLPQQIRFCHDIAEIHK